MTIKKKLSNILNMVNPATEEITTQNIINMCSIFGLEFLFYPLAQSDPEHMEFFNYLMRMYRNRLHFDLFQLENYHANLKKAWDINFFFLEILVQEHPNVVSLIMISDLQNAYYKEFSHFREEQIKKAEDKKRNEMIFSILVFEDAEKNNY